MVKNEKKIFLRKPAIFQPLMRETAKQHGFLHIGANLVAKRALGQMGQIHPRLLKFDCSDTTQDVQVRLERYLKKIFPNAYLYNLRGI